VSRPIGPGVGGSGGLSGNEAAWVVPVVGGLLLLASAATWVGGTLAAQLADGVAPAPDAPFHPLLMVQILRDGTTSLWPQTSPALVWTLAGVVALLAAAPLATVAVLLLRRRVRADDPRRSLATRREVAHLTLPAAATTAVRLRPSLTGRTSADLPPDELGLALGRLRTTGNPDKGPVLYSSWEDVVLAYMAPRSGKSTALAIPAVLSAPGAAVATSNKADVWAATAALRAQATEQRVWTFDPQSIAWAPRTWWWDPLADLSSVEEAERLAGHFVLTVDDERSKTSGDPPPRS
jgi:hypothetical protein